MSAQARLRAAGIYASVLRERDTIQGNRRLKVLAELCLRLTGGVAPPRVGPSSTIRLARVMGIERQGQLKGENRRALLPYLIGVQGQLMVTRRQIVRDLTAGEDGAKVFKGLDGPRVIPRIREPESDLKRRGPVYDLSQALPECLGPFLWYWAHLIDGNTANVLEGAAPLRKKIDLAVQGHDDMGVKSGHSSVENALLIRTQFAGHDMRWKDLWWHRRLRG